MVVVSFCALAPGDPGPFAQYVLPSALREVLQGDMILLGALWDGAPCGAAAVRREGKEARLVSLFVDPEARGHGIAGRMLELLTEEAKSRGALLFSARYALQGEELAAMDGLFYRRGACPALTAQVFAVESGSLSGRPLLRQAFRHDYRAPEAVAPFSSLTAEQLSPLDGSPVPPFLRPEAYRGRYDPELSFAWVEKGRVTVFALCAATGPNDVALLSAWSRPRAPMQAFSALLRAVANRCYFRMGGSFRCSFSAVTDRSSALAEKLAGDALERYEEHTVHFYL